MYDPTEEQLVEQAARDALEMLNASQALNGNDVRAKSVSKFIRSGNKLIRVHVSFVDDPARSSEDEG